AGDRAFSVLFEPGGRRALQGLFWCGDHLVLSILDNLEPVFELRAPSPDGWTAAQIGGMPRIGVAQVWPLDARKEESNGDLLASVQARLPRPSLLLIEPPAAPALLKQGPAAFVSTGLRVTRHEAVSSDGVRIPYVQTGPETATGDAPVHLMGYGGFRVSTLP